MSASIDQTLLQKIDDGREKAISFLQQMIAIPSVTGDEAKIQKFLADYMRKIGLDVDTWETDWEALKKHPGYRPVDRGYEGRPNIVATLKGSGGGRSLLLNGHTDVIPVGAAIVEALIGWAQAGNVIVSDRGVRWGLALELSTAFSPPQTGISSEKGA